MLLVITFVRDFCLNLLDILVIRQRWEGGGGGRDTEREEREGGSEI